MVIRTSMSGISNSVTIGIDKPSVINDNPVSATYDVSEDAGGRAGGLSLTLSHQLMTS